MLVTVGSTALVARFVGAGDRALAREVTHQSILLALVAGDLNFARAWTSGRISVKAGFTDLLKIRKLL